MLAEAGFIFAVCQIGAEKALKAEIDREWPALRFAFSRPGFVTFKLPEQTRWSLDVDLRSTFARTYGFSLGKVRGPEARELVPQVWQLAGNVIPAHVHTWQRDSAVPGERGFEPGITPLADEVGRLLLAAWPPGASASPPALNQVARPGEWVLDCVLVEPDEWWIGYHVATSPPTCWPGGVPEIAPRDDVVSRAYWKTIEALEWSRLPLRAGDHCAEIGSSPGGAVQALLDRGLTVLGIDPAEMDESLIGHEGLTHVRKRAMDMKRREFRDVKWLLADSNVAPHCTLDSVEAIVTHREVHVRGLLLTLKLLDWALAAQIPGYVARVRSWGFEPVRTRQLAYNRREICLAATRL